MAYKKNFLSKVICRCDFLDLFDIRLECPEPLKKSLRRMGPVEGVSKKLGGEFRITPDGIQIGGKIEPSMVWSFADNDKGKKISLSEDFFAIEYDKYESFDLLLGDFNDIKKIITETLGVFTAKRLGLRFIDVFTMGGGDPLIWNEFITPEYLVTTESIPDKKDRKFLSRAFNKKEYTRSDMRVLIQYGIHNPSYPSPINLRQYILDTDISSVGLLEDGLLAISLGSFHKEAKEIFESAITENLRKIMNE